MKKSKIIVVKESLQISNIGPLKAVNIEQIKPFTVLIGDSASGKSCILKITALFRYLFKVATVRAWLRSVGVKDRPITLSSRALWSRCGMLEMLTANPKITYTVAIRETQYIIAYKNGTFYLPRISDTSMLEYFKVSFISEYRNIIAPWIENNLRNSSAYIGFYFSEVYSDFLDSVRDVNEIYLPHFNLYLQRTRNQIGAHKLVITNKDKTNPFTIKFQNSASGIQSSVPIIAILKYYAERYDFLKAFNRSVLAFVAERGNLMEFKPKTDMSRMPKWVHFHIEEPELGLFPDSQIRLMDEIIHNLKNLQQREIRPTTMMTTHSPYLLNYLNILINRGTGKDTRLEPNDVSVYRLYNGELQNLVGKDTQTGRTLINTFDMSEQIAEMNREYAEL